MPVNKVRRNGSYAPLSAHYYKDDAVAEAGEGAELLFLRGLAFVADVLSDGFISETQLTRFVGVGMKSVTARANRLVTVGLWSREDGGYRVNAWLKWNRSNEEITGLQRKDADRKAGSKPEPDPEEPEPEPESERIPNGNQSDSDSDSEATPNGVQPRARLPLHSTPRNATPAPNARADLARKPSPAELAKTAHTIDAHKIISLYAESCPQRPPSDVLNRLAPKIDQLLAEKYTPAQIQTGLDEWGRKGLGAQLLPDIVHETINRGAPRKLHHDPKTGRAVDW